MSQSVRFNLSVPSETFLHVYQGVARNITVRADNGQVIQFPVQHIKQFLTHNGIYGYFEMMFSAENKFMSIKRLR